MNLRVVDWMESEKIYLSGKKKVTWALCSRVVELQILETWLSWGTGGSRKG